MIKNEKIFRQASKYFYSYAILAFDKSFFLFGGFNGGARVDSNVIASFDTETKQWKKLGEMNQDRSGHGVIAHNGHFVVVGGRGRIITNL